MNATSLSQFFRRFGLSPLGLAGFILVLLGLLLSASIHMGFFALVGVGAFGPAALRQFGLVHDLDEFQKEAVTRAAHRAYLVTGLFLTTIVIARQWGTRRFGDDLAPASLVLSVGALFFYRLIPLQSIPAERLFVKLFVVILIPVPMAAIGLALMSRTDNAEKPGRP